MHFQVVQQALWYMFEPDYFTQVFNDVHGQVTLSTQGPFQPLQGSHLFPHLCPSTPYHHPGDRGKMINSPLKVNHVLGMFLLDNGFIIRWQESSLWYLTGMQGPALNHGSFCSPDSWRVNYRTSKPPAPQCEIETQTTAVMRRKLRSREK